MKIISRVTPALILAILFVAPIQAQFETAVVLGSVKDSSSSVVPAVDLTLRDLETGIEAKTTTDADGEFLFRNVKVGRYRVTAGKAGFALAVVEDVNVTVGARQRVDVVLSIGQVTQTVEVTGVAGVESDSSDRGQVVKATVILVKGYEPGEALVKELQDHVKSVTAPYKYPRIVEFAPELPKTISGKIRRMEIREHDAAGGGQAS